MPESDAQPAGTPPPGPSSPAASAAPVPGAGGHPTGRVALVFTDIQGSTSLWEKLGDRFAPILELHNRLMREAIELNRGYEVKTVGDAFMIAFQDPLDAVKFAIDALESFGVMAWPEASGEILVRVGVHTGEPIVDIDPRNGRVDYFGPMVNCSARIESAAHGGQILIGKTTFDAVSGKLPGVELADLGEHRLKGIDSPERIYQVLSTRVPHRDFPPIATLTSLPTNLPYQLSSFVGREKELSEVTAMIGEPGIRLVTISGPGGTGKTRFSMRVGNLVLESLPGGVWVVNLARARTLEDVASAVASALGLQLSSGGESPERLVGNVLEYRKPLLLILDNFEQVAQHAVDTVGQWMSRAPKCKFLVTSQAVLGLQGEHEYRLGPLAVPPRADERRPLTGGSSVAAASTFDSVRLFVERAREANPAFALNELNARDVMTVCAELDGIPLAIELAAARAKIMTPAQMVERLSQKFQLLRSSRRDLPERHQTLQAAIEWSYELLSDWEKSCFQQDCIFRTGFSLEAAEEIVDLMAFPDAPLAMDAEQTLRDKSLLTTRETPFGVRFHLFKAMREFGEARWKPDVPLQERYARYYTRYAQTWDALRVGPRMIEALDRLEQKRENILNAADRMLALARPAEAAELVLAMAGYLAVRGVGGQRTAPIESVLAAAGAAPDLVPLPIRVRLTVALARAYETLGAYKAAAKWAGEAGAAAESLPDGPERAEALTTLAESRRQTGALAEATTLHARAEQMYAALNDRLGVARNLGGRAMILISRNALDDALACLVRAEAINRELHNATGLIANLSNLGRIARLRGDPDGATARFKEAETLCRETGDAALLARVLGNRGNTLLDNQLLDEALTCHAEAESVFREIGDRVNAARVVGNRADILRQKAEFQKSLELYDQALAVMREVGQKRSVGAFAASKCAVLVAMRSPQQALPLAEEAITMLKASGALFSQESYTAHCMRAVALEAAGNAGWEPLARDAARTALHISGTLRLHDRRPNMEELATLARLSRAVPAGS
ncbi:MAG: adenylate/guanylate cyclase domain-containing protein [Phycisphaerales bacterium]